VRGAGRGRAVRVVAERSRALARRRHLGHRGGWGRCRELPVAPLRPSGALAPGSSPTGGEPPAHLRSTPTLRADRPATGLPPQKTGPGRRHHDVHAARSPLRVPKRSWPRSVRPQDIPGGPPRGPCNPTKDGESSSSQRSASGLQRSADVGSQPRVACTDTATLAAKFDCNCVTRARSRAVVGDERSWTRRADSAKGATDCASFA
jgi:hypothetical protein